MLINEKTIEKLQQLINEETEYRSGPKLVDFFNSLGFNDVYGKGFPSRWIYTEDKLRKINGTPELDKCIRNLFNPVNFIGKISILDNHIKELNNYLAFDKWQVIRNGTEITFKRIDKIILHDDNIELKPDDFLEKEFNDLSIDSLSIDSVVIEIIKIRFEELKKCFTAGAHLSVIFISGSSLEGILLGVALKYPREFNKAKLAPRNKEQKAKQFQDWTLSQLIDTSFEIGILKEDVKKYSHVLRDFRNYIHPYLQLSSGFNPDEYTAKICFQVLKAAIFQISRFN